MENINGFVEIVFEITSSIDLLFERLENRAFCKYCGPLCYEKFRALNGKLVCGVFRCSEFTKRENDYDEIIKHRIVVNKVKTEKLSSFYKSKGIIATIDANQAIDDINCLMIEHINKHIA